MLLTLLLVEETMNALVSGFVVLDQEEDSPNFD
jgi:hypothetical protein